MFDSMIAFADIVPNYFSMGHDPRELQAHSLTTVLKS